MFCDIDNLEFGMPHKAGHIDEVPSLDVSG